MKYLCTTSKQCSERLLYNQEFCLQFFLSNLTDNVNRKSNYFRCYLNYQFDFLTQFEYKRLYCLNHKVGVIETVISYNYRTI